MYLRFDGDDKSAEISNEINLVIDARVAEIAEGFEEKDRRLIANRLKSMEHRTYLWLHLTIDIIMKSPSEYGRRVDVEALLASLPSEVSEAYEKILDKSKRHNYTEALLQILLAANRPLTLREANFALALATKEQGFESHAALEDELWPTKSFKDDVKNLCGLFISVYDRKLSFIHQTAREFLIHPQREGTWKGRFTLQKSHSRLSRACLQYLLLPGVAGVRAGRDAFLLYAAESWDLHYMSQEAADADLSRQDAHMVCCAASVWVIYRNWDIYYWRDLNSLAIASYLGLQRVVQDLLLKEEEAAILDTRGAIYLASENGQKEIVQMLLEHGADTNIEDLGKALLEPSRRGHKEIVQMLLERVTDVNTKGFSMALCAASERGHKEIVQMLLEHSAGVNIEGFGKALWFASKRGHKDVVQMLLEHNNAGVSIQDLSTALRATSDSGHEEIVQMLQERGAI